MPTVSIETVNVLLKIAFLLGAVVDGLAIIPMLSRRVGVALFGGDSSRNSVRYRYAWNIAASLLAGWTMLLLWGAAKPMERRDILLLTVFPVITGIIFATAMAARRRIILLSRAILLWIHLSVGSLFYIIVYILSIPFVP